MNDSDWVWSWHDFVPEREGHRESLCALGNGRFCTRGAVSEAVADDVHYPGTYAVGCYNRVVSHVSGRMIEHEDLVNLPNWLPLTWRIGDGEWFDLRRTEIPSYDLELDLRRGVLTRTLRCADEAGRRTTVTTRRLVSMADPYLAGQDMTLVAENWSGRVTVRSALDGRVANDGVARYRDLEGGHLMPISAGQVGEDTIRLVVETNQSRIRIAEAARTRVRADCEVALQTAQGYIAQEASFDLAEGEAVTVEKVVALYTSRDLAISECALAAQQAMARAPDFAKLLDAHVRAWRYLWEQFAIEVDTGGDGEDRTLATLRLHIFHLLQTCSPNTIGLDAGVPARALTGEAYRGHVFWDELFIFPTLNLRIPEITRALLMYRYRRLDQARAAAAEAGYAGAMFPWQSGSDGREESQSVHLNPRSGRWIPDNSALQHHVNAAIVYNICQYYHVTGDVEFLAFYGAEVIYEIARFWASIATPAAEPGGYEIRGVMGPDEYHEAYPDSDRAGLDNNAYPNVMAVWVLHRALELQDTLPADQQQRLCEKLKLAPSEFEAWREISRGMIVPFHGDGIISQFAGYEKLAEFDWDGYRRRYGDIQRLDRILEAEDDTPNRYKASKQAYVLMLFYLFSSEQLRTLFEVLGYPFEYETIPRNIDYYVARTSDGSTLSRVVHSWVVARSDRAGSWRLFREALTSDVADIQGGTTPEGVHLGAMAGTVDLIQRGYAGIEPRGGVLYLNPSLPDEVRHLKFRLRYRGHSLGLEFTRTKVRVTAVDGAAEPITIGLGDQEHRLGGGESLELSLDGVGQSAA
jgi:alpha,alpha-trehalase